MNSLIAREGYAMEFLLICTFSDYTFDAYSLVIKSVNFSENLSDLVIVA